jgi:hypothetical protein
MPIAFQNYNNLNGMGFGIKTMSEIKKDTVVLKIKT